MFIKGTFNKSDCVEEDPLGVLFFKPSDLIGHR